jgi:regulator of cell morphogenesis and NO signaling
MNRFDAKREVGSIVAEAPATSRVFERFGIDYCCGGNQPVAAACAARGLPTEEVLGALEREAGSPIAEDRDWRGESLSALLDHILEAHHEYLRREIPRLRGLVRKVQEVHGDTHPGLFPELARLFERLVGDLEPHMEKEEMILFPAIRSLESGGPAPIPCGHLAGPIRVMEWEHEEVGGILQQMRRLTAGYEPPGDACASFVTLYRGLAEMEADLHRHIHLENNVLHPRALAAAEGRRP